MTNTNRPGHSKKVLITGATSGIGWELARLFAGDGYDLVLVSRYDSTLRASGKKLESTYGISVKYIVKDLSHPASPQEIFNELQKDTVRIDILVNNAGFGAYGPFAETDLMTERQMMQLNMVTPTHLTKLFLDEMLKSGGGKILNVASTAAFQPGPLMAVYYATKAYLLSFSEAIASELEGTGVTVTALCPGPTSTGFGKRAKMEGARLVRGKIVMDAETVARIGYKGLMRGKTLVVPGLINKILRLGPRTLPRKLVARMVKSIQKKD